MKSVNPRYAPPFPTGVFGTEFFHFQGQKIERGAAPNTGPADVNEDTNNDTNEDTNNDANEETDKGTLFFSAALPDIEVFFRPQQLQTGRLITLNTGPAAPGVHSQPHGPDDHSGPAMLNAGPTAPVVGSQPHGSDCSGGCCGGCVIL